jgi:hypothetical protein
MKNIGPESRVIGALNFGSLRCYELDSVSS